MAVSANCSLEASASDDVNNISRLFSQVFNHMLRLFSLSVILRQFRTEEEHSQNQEYDCELYQYYQPKRLSDFHIPEAVAIKIVYPSEDVHSSNLTKKPDRRQPVRFLFLR